MPCSQCTDWKVNKPSDSAHWQTQNFYCGGQRLGRQVEMGAEGTCLNVTFCMASALFWHSRFIWCARGACRGEVSKSLRATLIYLLGVTTVVSVSIWLDSFLNLLKHGSIWEKENNLTKISEAFLFYNRNFQWTYYQINSKIKNYKLIFI